MGTTGDVYVPPRGSPNAKIMFVGEAPGSQEVLRGQPFVGPAGGVLSEMLLKSGIDESECFFTNLCKYQPPTTFPRGGGKPRFNDLSAWIPKGVPSDERVINGIDELIAEVERVNPNVIVPLGNWPLWAFYGQRPNKKGEITGIGDYRGYLLESRKVCKGRKIIPTYHPSYYLHGSSSEAGLGILDLRRAAKESGSPAIVRRPRVYYIDPQGDERERLRRRLLDEGPILFLDIEYIGTTLKCVGFSVSPDWAVSVKIRPSSSGGLDDLAWVRSLVESGKPLGAQNAMYDLGILEWHYGISAFDHLVYDTMVAAYVLNIEHLKNLGFLGSMYTDMPAWWDVIDWDKIKDGRQSIDELLPYNCGDNVVCAEVAEKQQPELDSDPKFREAFQFDMRKLKPLWRTSRRGCPINVQKFLDLKQQVKKEIKEDQDSLNEVVDALGMDRSGDFNVKSGIQVSELLAAWLDVDLTKKTKGGEQWATDNMILLEYARRNPTTLVKGTIEKVIRVRESRDIESKFFNIDWDTDWRARCTYDCTKTVTRRLSSKTFFPTNKGDNLQNVPAPNSSPRYGGLVRSVFIPDPGLKFGYADLKGAEFLIVAWLTQDPLMLKFAEMSMTGTGNVHKETASFMFNMKAEDVDKESPFYFLGKKMRHSGNYLIGWKELMARINGEAIETGVWVDAATCKTMIARYLELHPMLPAWWDEVRIEAKETGKLRNLFGFIRTINDKVERSLPALVAFKPQSTVGDALNYGLIACDEDQELRDYKFEILLQVHDAIGFQYDPKYETQCLNRVRKLMTKEIYIPKTDQMMAIPIEIQTGESWHPLHDWQEAA